MGDKRKRQLNLQGVLRFALEGTKSEDAGRDSKFEEMDDERKMFLESALKAMTVDVIDEFQKAIGILEDIAAKPMDKIYALNIIREHIDDVDFANSFIKVGGAHVILQQLKATDRQIRVISPYIIAEMSQNNPYGQRYFTEANTIPLLLSYLNDDEESAVSALHAISSLVRSFEPGLIEFLRNGGVKSLISCLDTCYSRVFVKACFLIAILSSENNDVRDTFIDNSTISILLTFLEPIIGFDIKMETVLFALAELSKSNKWCIKAEQRQHLHSILNSIIINGNEPDCEEILAYANLILEKVNSGNRM